MLNPLKADVQERSRIKELDVLRGIAALAVLLSHYTSMYDFQHGLDNSLGFSVSGGCYGVLLFFVISGFVILMTLCKCKTALDFPVSRFSRIFPAYWVALILTFFLLRLLKPNPPGVVDLLVNFTMLQRFLGFKHLDAVYWTLNVELSFYCWMFLVYRLGLLERLNRIVAGALLFQLGASLWQTSKGIHASQGLQAVFLLEYVHLFCAGMLFYQIKQNGWNLQAGLLLCWCLINHIFIPFRWFPWIPLNHWGVVAVFAVFVTMTLVVSGRLGWIVSVPTVFLGTISYPLYLLHDEVGRALMDRLSQWGFSRWEGFGCSLGIVLLLATALTFLVEQPSLKWIRRKYAELKSSKLPTPVPACD